jgi:hypothetical protein
MFIREICEIRGKNPPMNRKTLQRLGIFAAMVAILVVAFHFILKDLGKAVRGLAELPSHALGASGNELLQFCERLAHDMDKVVHATPVVTVTNTVVFQETKPIAELALASRALTVESSYTHEWLGSTKTLTLSGQFLAKAGFDLNAGFQVNVQDKPRRIQIILPPPKLLSCEMTNAGTVSEDNGWWNRISAEDRDADWNSLRDEAKREAAVSSIILDARHEIEARLRAVPELANVPVEFVYTKHPNAATLQMAPREGQ